MLLLSNMVLIQEQSRSCDHSPFSAVSLTHKNWGLIFCFAKPLTGRCSAEILRLKVAKLRLNFCILSKNCDWNFSLISSPESLWIIMGAWCLTRTWHQCLHRIVFPERHASFMTSASLFFLFLLGPIWSCTAACHILASSNARNQEHEHGRWCKVLLSLVVTCESLLKSINCEH